jgi:uncharacterized protein (TIGR02246 family)
MTPTLQNTTDFSLGSVKEAVAERNAMFQAAMSRGDAAGVAECYTMDAEFMAGGAPAVAGRSNIQATMAGYIAQGFTKYQVLTTTVYGDIGVVGVQSEYNLSHQDGSNLDNGKSIQLWKQEMGAWKIFRDCFNSNLPGGN